MVRQGCAVASMRELLPGVATCVSGTGMKTDESTIEQTLDETELDLLLSQTTRPVLLQFSSHTCPRCPEFAEAVAADAQNYSFEHRLVMVTEATELVEKFQISKLPAFTILPPTIAGATAEPQVFQAASIETLKEAVRACCAPRFKLDSDF